MKFWRALADRLLFGILRVPLEETAADVTAATLAARRRTAEAALEALDFAKSVDVSGDEDKAKVLAAFRADLADIAEINRSLLSGTIPLAAGRESLDSAPFGAGPSGPPSVNGHAARPLPGPEPTTAPAPTAGQDGTPPPPPKRPRGRPPKHPRPEPTA
ncbi:MAG: hypothetical protein ACYCS7_03915 [Acidimicrobiales bacterium]